MSNFFVALAVFLITVVGALFTVPYFCLLYTSPSPRD